MIILGNMIIFNFILLRCFLTFFAACLLIASFHWTVVPPRVRIEVSTLEVFLTNTRILEVDQRKHPYSCLIIPTNHIVACILKEPAQPSRHVRSQGDQVCSRGFSVTWDPRVTPRNSLFPYGYGLSTSSNSYNENNSN